MSVTVDKRGRLRDPGPGWTASGKGVTRRFAHESGWVVDHCGHPTATTPWAVYDPEGRIHLSGVTCQLGRAFQHAADAVRHVEKHLQSGTCPCASKARHHERTTR